MAISKYSQLFLIKVNNISQLFDELFLIDVWSAEGRLQLKRGQLGIGEPEQHQHPPAW